MGRAMISILVSLGIAFGMYVFFLKRMSPGGSPQHAMSTTTVETQLVHLAEAERIHYVQNNSYATLEQLAANGEFKMTNPDPNGYVYSVGSRRGEFPGNGQTSLCLRQERGISNDHHRSGHEGSSSGRGGSFRSRGYRGCGSSQDAIRARRFGSGRRCIRCAGSRCSWRNQRGA